MSLKSYYNISIFGKIGESNEVLLYMNNMMGNIRP